MFLFVAALFQGEMRSCLGELCPGLVIRDRLVIRDLNPHTIPMSHNKDSAFQILRLQMGWLSVSEILLIIWETHLRSSASKVLRHLTLAGKCRTHRAALLDFCQYNEPALETLLSEFGIDLIAMTCASDKKTARLSTQIIRMMQDYACHVRKPLYKYLPNYFR